MKRFRISALNFTLKKNTITIYAQLINKHYIFLIIESEKLIYVVEVIINVSYTISVPSFRVHDQLPFCFFNECVRSVFVLVI